MHSLYTALLFVVVCLAGKGNMNRALICTTDFLLHVLLFVQQCIGCTVLLKGTLYINYHRLKNCETFDFAYIS